MDLLRSFACLAAFILMAMIVLLSEHLRPSRAERYVETLEWCVVGSGDGCAVWRVQKIKFLNGIPQVPSGDLVVFRSNSYSDATDVLAKRMAADRDVGGQNRKPR